MPTALLTLAAFVGGAVLWLPKTPREPNWWMFVILAAGVVIGRITKR